MKPSHRVWYVAFALMALVPLGLRVVTWHQQRPKPVDPAMAVAGQALFVHEWRPHDPLTGGDGLGPVYNAKSCLACHHQARPGGGGGVEHNVTVYTIRPQTPGGKAQQGVIHARAVNDRARESLRLVDPSLPDVSQPNLSMLVSIPGHRSSCVPMPPRVLVSQRNTPALFGAKRVDEIPERLILANQRAEQLKWGMAPAGAEQLPVGRALRLADGRIGRFGWKAQTATLSDFVQQACANELGLSNPGAAQPTPLAQPKYRAVGLDLSLEQCDQLTDFVRSLPQPEQRVPDNSVDQEQAGTGQKLFGTTGCADCHTPNVGSVRGIYSDLLLHSMGEELQGGGSYGEPPRKPGPDGRPEDEPGPTEWRTPPLWGVADSAPYMHDGRASTLAEAITLHGGQAAGAARRFRALTEADKASLIAFLKTLRAPQ